jgi:hypothetical protein
MWYSSARLVTPNTLLKLTVALQVCNSTAYRYPAFSKHASESFIPASGGASRWRRQHAASKEHDLPLVR